MSAGADSLKSIFFALGANFAIAVSKLAAALFTGSGAMLAEAIHSFSDCGNQLLLILGLKTAKKPPTPDHPLGYGKEIYFWSFIVALILFSMGGLFSIYEGVHKLANPEALRFPWVAVGVLVFGIVAESVSLWGCVQEINKARGDRPMLRWLKETRSSELIVVFGEDIAALFGLAFALLAIALAMITGNPMWDAIGSIGIGVLLVLVAIFVGWEIKALLVGQGVEPAHKKAIESVVVAQPEVLRVFNIITLQLGADVMLAVKAELAPYGSTREVAEAINRVERQVREKFPEVKWIFFEPDVAD